MMKLQARHFLGVLIVAALAAPLWARGGSFRTDSTTYDTLHAVMIGSASLQPGHYRLKAKEGQSPLTILQNGKVIATVPCHWVKLPSKAHNSEILSNKNQVTRVEFQGREEAVKVG